jgi:excisionase family DNA binding protein
MKKKVYMLTEKGIKLLAEQISNNLKGNLHSSPDSEDNVFITIEEAAELLSLSKYTIYGLVHKNKIPYHKKGRLYFLKSELLDWIRIGKRESKSSIEVKANEYLAKNSIQ